MAEYLNTQMKEVALCLAGCHGLMDTLDENLPDKLLPHRKTVRTIRTLAGKLLQECLRDIDEEQLQYLQRWTNNTELLVVPRSDVRGGKKYMIMDAEQVKRILKYGLNDCALCLKTPTEVKQCQLRKDLLQSGVMPKPGGRGECPFQP